MRLIVLCLLLTQFCKAQSADSLRIAIIENKIHTIQLNLDKCHKEHNVGVGLALAGSILTTLASTQIESKKYHYQNNIIMLIGSTVTFSGLWLIFDSHKYIGRAAK